MTPRWWKDTLTLYRRTETTDENGRRSVAWEREVLRRCFFALRSVSRFEGNLFRDIPIFIVRVPSDQCRIFRRGDIIMKGEISLPEPDLREDNTFILGEVHDNSGLQTAHYYGRSEDQ